MKVLFILVLIRVVPVSFAQTLEPILFSSKQELPSSEIASPHFSYDVADMESQTNTRASELLRKIPGVELSQTGVVGGEASLFIRGSESRHTLILIDGIKVYDPTSTGRSLNLAILNTLDIERVEVLKGSQSVLYGSDAIGGVINIITKKGASKDSVKLSTGYFDELALENTFSLGDGVLYMNLSLQESEFDSEARGGTQKDLSSMKGLTVNYSIEKGNFESEFMMKMTESFSEVDQYDFSSFQVEDDLSSYAKNKHSFVKEKIIYRKSAYQTVYFDMGYNKFDRKNKYKESLDYSTSQFSGSTLETDIRLSEELLDGHLLLGSNWIKETYQDDNISEKELFMFDLYTHRTLKKGNALFEYGTRFTRNQDYGTHLVYDLGAMRSLSKTQSIGIAHKTGFKAPSIYQQKAPEYDSKPVGNEDLSPEKSQGLELNYMYKGEPFLANISFFYNEVEAFIDYNYVEGYNNISKTIYKGVEFGGSWRNSSVEFGTSSTLINYATSSGVDVERRPNFSVVNYYSQHFSDRHLLKLDWSWKGRRFEHSNGERVELKAYDVLDINYIFSYENKKLVTSVKNAFARDYEVARGYSSLRGAIEVSFIYTY